MSKVMLELHEFFVEGGDPEKSHVFLTIAEPSDALEGEKKGYFFALAELNNGTKEQIEHIQQMFNDIESGYYETDDQKNKTAFELTLEYINRRGHHLLREKKSILHCVVGVLLGDQISFSYHGKPAIKMAYTKNDKLEVMDIIDSDERLPNQLFSAIMQGKIKENDFFFIASPKIEKHISNRQISDAFLSRQPKHTAMYFEKILGSLRDNFSYGGVIFHMASDNKKIIPHKIITSEKPIEHQKEIFAEKPPKEVHKPVHKDSETNYRPREWNKSEPFWNVILVSVGRSIVAGLLGIFKLLKSFFVFLGRIFVGLFLLITNSGGQRDTVLQSLHRSLLRVKKYIEDIPLVSKILFFLMIIFLIGFVLSASYMRLKKDFVQKQLSYKNLVQAIVDKTTAAESSMIYDDESKAFALLKEATALLDTLPTTTQDQKNKKGELQNNIAASIKILQKINTVQPEMLVDLTSIQSSANATQLALINSDLLAYGSDDLFAYKLNLSTNALEKKEHESIPHLTASDTPKEQDKIVFLTKNNGIAEYNPKSNTFSAKDLPASEKANLSTVFVYSQRIYTIDTFNNQIFKHSPTQTGYDRGSPWIKNSKADVSDGVSMAIDGDLFLLKSNGTILKFTSGVQKDFAISGLDPTLDKPAKIWTYANVKNLYVLEPTNKRVVILDKQGKMLQQYTADSWKNPTGMIVDEAKKVVYVLDDNKIYRFGIE